jgi:hypothetical protein
VTDASEVEDDDYNIRINKIFAINITLDCVSLFRWDIDLVNEIFYAMKIFPNTSIYQGHADIFLRGPPL